MRTRRMSNRFTSGLVAILLLGLGPVGAAWAQVKVTSAEPEETLQGTVSLDVTVNGSGFNNSAAVKFLVAGTDDTGGVTVTKVTFKSSKQLIATIDVAASASVDKFDIEVALSDGRKGKGTTLFAVLKKIVSTTRDPCAATSPDYAANWMGFPSYAYIVNDLSAGTYEIRIASRNGICSKRVGDIQPGRAGGPTSFAGNAPGQYVFTWARGGTMLARFSVPTAGETGTAIPATFSLFRGAGTSGDLSPDGSSLVYSYGSAELDPMGHIRIASLADATGSTDLLIQVHKRAAGAVNVWWAPWDKIYYTEMNVEDGKRLLAIGPYGPAPQSPEVLLQLPAAEPLVVGRMFQLGSVSGGYAGYDSSGAVPNVVFQGYYTTGIKRGGSTGSWCVSAYSMHADSHAFLLGSVNAPSAIIGFGPSVTTDATALFERTQTPTSNSSCTRLGVVGESAVVTGAIPQVIQQVLGSWPAALKTP